MKMKRTVLSAVIFSLTVQAAMPAFASASEHRDLSKVFKALSDEQTAEELSSLSVAEKKTLLRGVELILEDDAIRLAYAQETLKTENETYYELGKASGIALSGIGIGMLGAYLLEGKNYRGGNVFFGAGVLSMFVFAALGHQMKGQRAVVKVNRQQVDDLLKKIETQRSLIKAITQQLESQQ